MSVRNAGDSRFADWQCDVSLSAAVASGSSRPRNAGASERSMPPKPVDDAEHLRERSPKRRKGPTAPTLNTVTVDRGAVSQRIVAHGTDPRRLQQSNAAWPGHRPDQPIPRRMPRLSAPRKRNWPRPPPASSSPGRIGSVQEGQAAEPAVRSSRCGTPRPSRTTSRTTRPLSP